jgi:hypothetical protein
LALITKFNLSPSGNFTPNPGTRYYRTNSQFYADGRREVGARGWREGRRGWEEGRGRKWSKGKGKKGREKWGYVKGEEGKGRNRGRGRGRWRGRRRRSRSRSRSRRRRGRGRGRGRGRVGVGEGNGAGEGFREGEEPLFYVFITANKFFIGRISPCLCKGSVECTHILYCTSCSVVAKRVLLQLSRTVANVSFLYFFILKSILITMRQKKDHRFRGAA